MTVPTKRVPVPSVAEEPTCQKTLHACAPFTSNTAVLEPLISVEPIWKMNTAFGSPCASSVTLPEDSSSELLAGEVGAGRAVARPGGGVVVGGGQGVLGRDRNGVIYVCLPEYMWSPRHLGSRAQTQVAEHRRGTGVGHGRAAQHREAGRRSQAHARGGAQGAAREGECGEQPEQDQSCSTQVAAAPAEGTPACCGVLVG